MTSNAMIFLSAGEASGDQYGAELIAVLKARLAGSKYFGLGGTKMAAAGLTRVVRAEDVAMMGITEVILHMPRIYGEYRRLVRSIKAQKPDVAVLIDFPDVNLRLARELKKLGVPVVFFVSPQLWAWKRGRLKWVQERVDRMMVIFPFEEAFYRARGVDAQFVGHPLAEDTAVLPSREEYALKHGLDARKDWMALLPGSRKKEVAANFSEMMLAARLLQGYEFLVPVASTLDAGWVREQMPAGFAKVVMVPDAREALHHVRASVVASGTATVLAAVAGNPFVIVYRVSGMTYRAAKWLVRYPAEISAKVDEAGNLPVGMVNLIAGRRVVPELLQERFTAENVAAALAPLLAEGAERDQMIGDLAEVRDRLVPVGEGGMTAIERVAGAVVAILEGKINPTSERKGGRISPASV